MKNTKTTDYIGYCRISTVTQSIERQIRNIKAAFPDAELFAEAKSGTKLDGRVELDRALKRIDKSLQENHDVTFIVDSISRLSRNADEGIRLYFDLYDAGVKIISLKEPQCNSDVYRDAAKKTIDAKISTGNAPTDKLISGIMDAVNEFMRELAKQQIIECFKQAQKEVDDLHQRTKEGIETARAHGKQIGAVKGRKQKSAISDNIKEIIKSKHKDFNGSMNDTETIAYIKGTVGHCARNTYYKCKKELQENTEITDKTTD